jgi:hypothetical protein
MRAWFVFCVAFFSGFSSSSAIDFRLGGRSHTNKTYVCGEIVPLRPFGTRSRDCCYVVKLDNGKIVQATCGRVFEFKHGWSLVSKECRVRVEFDRDDLNFNNGKIIEVLGHRGFY